MLAAINPGNLRHAIFEENEQWSLAIRIDAWPVTAEHSKELEEQGSRNLNS